MQALKREACLGVIELRVGHALPAIGRVAVLATVAKLILMHVPVAGLASLVVHARELDVDAVCGIIGSAHRRVAFLAGLGLVQAGEDKLGLVVIETGRGAPAILGVALAARGGELTAMLIAMATDASCVQAKIRLAEIFLSFLEFVTRLDELISMTGAAIERRVLAVQRESRQGVLEVLLPVLPIDQIVVTSLMLDVAFLAVVVLRFGVQSLSDGDAGLQFGVAFQAVHADLRAVTIVAAPAVLHAVEKGMRLVQVARR